MRKMLKSIFYFSLFFLFFSFAFLTEARAEISVPKIIKLTTGTTGENFSLAGTAPANCEVLIYLDGNLVGQTAVKSTANAEPSFDFRYQPALALADGTHSVMAVAQDKTSLVLSSPSGEIKFTINSVPAPTLIAPNEKTITADLEPLIIGLTKSQTKIKIFIDGNYNGQTEILTHGSGTADFAYKPFFKLARGSHEIYAVAEDGAGQTSGKSNILNLNIELPMPAPTMIKTVVNSSSTPARPFIAGLAKNNSLVKVYIDKKFSGEFLVKNHPSGTANFAYRPPMVLARGSHQVYTVALDMRGKTSILSNAITFQIKTAAIAQSAQEDRNRAVASIDESAAEAEKDEVGTSVISSGTGKVEKENKEKEINAIKGLIASSSSTALKNVQGSVDEGKQNQGKLKLSLVLFTLFFIGVVGWLLWVNRELIKERKAQVEAEEKKDKPAAGQENKLL